MFTFIKYLSPTWYYILRGKNFKEIWINYETLSEDEKRLLDVPDSYSTKEALLFDVAYQAWLKGFIPNGQSYLPFENEQLELKDEYRFTKRHFNPIWIYYVCLIRLLELNNPFKEIAAAVSTIRVKRINPYRQIVDWKPRLESFDSQLLRENKKVSVIIPTLNRYEYLKDVLHDLEKQNYGNFEVLIVDQSTPYNAKFYEAFNLNINVWYQEEKALWRARNEAIRKSEGDLILLFDDDSRVEPDWISSHIRCLDFFQADISSGVSISKIGAKVPETYSHYKWSDQVDTGNVLIKKEVFKRIGLFDRQFEKQRQGDGEFGLRAYLSGFKNISNPDAKRLHLKVSEGGLREMGSWDGWRPKKFFAPRPVPSVLYLTRKYFGSRAAVYQILQSVLPSVIPYRFKSSRPMMITGSILGIFLLPAIFISVIKSWRQSSRKLAEGAKISNLE